MTSSASGATNDFVAIIDGGTYELDMPILAPTASITIRNLDGRVKERLRIRAARNGRSMEAEARSILSDTLAPETDETLNLAEAIRRRVAPLGGIELEEHPAVAIGTPPSFGR